VNTATNRAWLATVVRLILAAVWIWASVSKLGDPRTFLRAVRAYDATPEWLSATIGYGLPILELCLGLLLIIGLATRVTAIVSSALLVIFTIGIVQAAARGIKLECGCFGGGGASSSTSYLLDIARDLGLLVLSAYLVIFAMSKISVDEIIGTGRELRPPSAKRVRRDPKAIRRYEAQVSAHQREANARLRFIAGTTAVVVVLVCLIGASVQSSRAKIQGDLTAANASVSNGVTVGKATAPTTLDVYEDFQCPICEALETSAHADLTKLVTAGTVRIRYHMMAFLDSSSNGNRYSSRAANAGICASDVSVADFAAYHDVLYGKDSSGTAVQPAEGSDGRSDAQLEQYFKQAVPKATSTQSSTFSTCVSTEQHKALVEAITNNASKRGVSGTPTVYVNGSKVSGTTASDVLKKIADVQAKEKKN
jgi:protein-disulfide isomerase